MPSSQPFHYRRDLLRCEGVPIPRIANEVGTPAYIYSAPAMERAYRRLDTGLSGVPHKICYSVKCNSNQSVLRLFASLGSGFDIVSGGELYRLRRIGVGGEKIVFSGVGKTPEEMVEALRWRVLLLNVESEAELEELARQARRMRIPARVGIRVNPDIEATTHPHISTGTRAHKFGILWQEVPRIAKVISGDRWIRLCGLSCHIGSQILSLEPFRSALRCMRALFEQLRAKGMPLQYLDVGGGLGIPYGSEKAPGIEDYARVLREGLAGMDGLLLLEPGRILVGPAGVLVTRVLLTKENQGKRFVVVDAAMNDFLRPALYGARHRILPVRRSGRRAREAEVVGPVCETGDSFGTHRVGDLRPGDLLAIADTGAYGFCSSSNYNSRVRPVEVLVKGRGFRQIRRRESREDLIRGER